MNTTLLSSRSNRRTFTGAWIETDLDIVIELPVSVAPLRVRGLKLNKMQQSSLFSSRTFTGAWIETSKFYILYTEYECRTFTGAWIETGYKVGR